MNTDLLETHPCYNEDAHKKYARIHLPVAPGCNIQCNYCNRKYDCCNESRPGVTSSVLSPEEAVERVRAVKEKMPELSVAAIAGPGDPLANSETIETISLIRNEFPDLTLCISTNGLMLPDSAESLYGHGVRFITVTMNACDIGISSKIYEFVIWKGKKLTGNDAAEILLKNQLDGIRKCVDMGIFVKVNIVLIPGVNDGHIPKLADLVKKMGVYIVNILPLIPVEGSRFSGLRAPAPGERRRLAEICSDGVRMMRHCKQCRADAVGLLDDDRSGEFTAGNCGSGCGPADMTSKRKDNGIRIAAASEDGITISGGFGNTGSFRKYVVRDNGIKDDGIVYVKEHGGVYGDAHTRHIMDRMALLKDTDIVIVREIGPRPLNELRNAGKHVHIASGSVEDAIHKAISSMSG